MDAWEPLVLQQVPDQIGQCDVGTDGELTQAARVFFRPEGVFLELPTALAWAVKTSPSGSLLLYHFVFQKCGQRLTHDFVSPCVEMGVLEVI